MKAVVYQEPFRVEVENVDDPGIEDPTDVVVRITSTAICGSDLHMYEGRTSAKPGIVFGHENQGVVVEVGPGVASLREGNRVNLPFNIGCGFCNNCEGGYSGFCLTANPGFAGSAYGYVNMGPYRGGRAEYLRVPFADYNCLRLPQGAEHEADFAMLSDIFPTGYHGAEMAEVGPGDTVAVFGAGPVGIMAAYSCLIRGAAVVYVVDRVPERLEKAAEIGCVPIDFTHGDPARQIKEMRSGDGVMKGIDAVGYQAVAHDGEEEQPKRAGGGPPAAADRGVAGRVLPPEEDQPPSRPPPAARAVANTAPALEPHRPVARSVARAVDVPASPMCLLPSSDGTDGGTGSARRSSPRGRRSPSRGGRNAPGESLAA